jgi:hypothetical protein
LASPDGYIPETDHLLEIKGLASQRDRKVIEAIKGRQSLKSYPYIQQQMKNHISRRKMPGDIMMGLSVVDFVVFTDVDLVYFPIQFDEAFFSDLKSKLQQWHEAYIKPLLTSQRTPKFL